MLTTTLSTGDTFATTTQCLIDATSDAPNDESNQDKDRNHNDGCQSSWFHFLVSGHFLIQSLYGHFWMNPIPSRSLLDRNGMMAGTVQDQWKSGA